MVEPSFDFHLLSTSFNSRHSSVSLTVVGSGLGALDYTGASRVGVTACEASEWLSDSSMQCNTLELILQEGSALFSGFRDRSTMERNAVF
jgi:hypothetical protein